MPSLIPSTHIALPPKPLYPADTQPSQWQRVTGGRPLDTFVQVTKPSPNGSVASLQHWQGRFHRPLLSRPMADATAATVIPGVQRLATVA